jgi:hypothetical protein
VATGIEGGNEVRYTLSGPEKATAKGKIMGTSNSSRMKFVLFTLEEELVLG